MDPNHHCLPHHARCHDLAPGGRNAPVARDALAALVHAGGDFGNPAPFDNPRRAWRRAPARHRRETA